MISTNSLVWISYPQGNCQTTSIASLDGKLERTFICNQSGSGADQSTPVEASFGTKFQYFECGRGYLVYDALVAEITNAKTGDLDADSGRIACPYPESFTIDNQVGDFSSANGNYKMTTRFYSNKPTYKNETGWWITWSSPEWSLTNGFPPNFDKEIKNGNPEPHGGSWVTGYPGPINELESITASGVESFSTARVSNGGEVVVTGEHTRKGRGNTHAFGTLKGYKLNDSFDGYVEMDTPDVDNYMWGKQRTRRGNQFDLSENGLRIAFNDIGEGAHLNNSPAYPEYGYYEYEGGSWALKSATTWSTRNISGDCKMSADGKVFIVGDSTNGNHDFGTMGRVIVGRISDFHNISTHTITFGTLVANALGDANVSALGRPETIDISDDGGVIVVTRYDRVDEHNWNSTDSFVLLYRWNGSGYVRDESLNGVIGTTPGVFPNGETPTKPTLSGDGNTLVVVSTIINTDPEGYNTIKAFEYTNGSWVQKGSSLDFPIVPLGSTSYGDSGTAQAESIEVSQDGNRIATSPAWPNQNRIVIYDFVDGDWKCVLKHDMSWPNPEANVVTKIDYSKDMKHLVFYKIFGIEFKVYDVNYLISTIGHTVTEGAYADIRVTNHEIASYNGIYTQSRTAENANISQTISGWHPSGDETLRNHEYPVWMQVDPYDGVDKFIFFGARASGERKRWYHTTRTAASQYIDNPYFRTGDTFFTDSGSWGHEDTFIGTNEHIQIAAGDFAPHYGGMPWTSTWSTNLVDNNNPNWPPTTAYEYLGTYAEPSSDFCLMPGDTKGNEPGWYRFAGFADGHPGSGPSGDGEYPYWELDGHSGTSNNAYRIFMVESSSYPTTTHWTMRMTTTTFTFPRTEYPWDYSFPPIPGYEITISEGVCPTSTPTPTPWDSSDYPYQEICIGKIPCNVGYINGTPLTDEALAVKACGTYTLVGKWNSPSSYQLTDTVYWKKVESGVATSLFHREERFNSLYWIVTHHLDEDATPESPGIHGGTISVGALPWGGTMYNGYNVHSGDC